MKQQTSNTKLPYIIAIFTFLAISFFYFSAVFEGKTLTGHDTESWIGMYQEAKVFNNIDDDGTLWTNSMFGGMPTYQIGMPKHYTALTPLYKVLEIFPRPVYSLFLYLIGFYILLLSLRVNPWLSMVGAIAFAFGSYNFIILAVGHNTKAIAIAYMAPLIGSIIMSFRWKRWTGVALTALFLALAVGANHLQILYYTLIVLIIFGISEFIYALIEKRVKAMLITFALLIGAAAVGVGVNSVMLLTTKEYSEYTMRGKTNGLTIDKTSKQEGLEFDYITNWSYGIDETMTLLIPNYKGGASQSLLPVDSNTGEALRDNGMDADKIMTEYPMPTYWGSQPGTSGPVYIGAIVCFLFVFGLFIVEGKNKWWLLAATLLSFLLAWGKNLPGFTQFMIDYVPLYNMFRAVSMTLIIAAFTISFLGFLALKKAFSPEADKSKIIRGLYIAGGIMGGITLLFSLFPGMAGDFVAPIDANMAAYGYPEFFKDTLPEDRMDLLQADAFRSFLFIALSFGVIWLYLKKNLKLTYVYIALGILLLVDMVPVAKRYLNNDNFVKEKKGSYFKQTAADKAILEDKSYYRVLNITADIFNDSKTSYFHKSIGGYHAAKLRRYQELINMHLDREIGNTRSYMQNATSVEMIQDALAYNQILNMLNLKYLIYNPEAAPIQNPFANGNAWFVKDCFIAQTADEEMLKLGTLNTRKQLVADKAFQAMIPAQVAYDSTAIIELTQYAPNQLTYESKATKEQVAVFSEIYYEDGWNAYVDGKLTPHFRANYLLRAMVVPAGTHTIVFKFEPKTYSTGVLISSICSLLLLLGLGTIIYLEIKKRKQLG